MAASFKFVPATWLINVTLAANLILLANDVSLNPGPGSAPPVGMKGLRIYHLNIHSLCNKPQYSSQIVETDTVSLEFSGTIMRFLLHTVSPPEMCLLPPQC